MGTFQSWFGASWVPMACGQSLFPDVRVPFYARVMRFDRRRLSFLALCALNEAWLQSREGPVPASPGLRLALAYLYHAGKPHGEWFDREPYDNFWQAATREDECGGSAAAFGRSQKLTASFNAIARAAKMEGAVRLGQPVPQKEA